MYRVVLLLHVPQKLLIAKVLKPAELTKYLALKIYKSVERTAFIFFYQGWEHKISMHVCRSFYSMHVCRSFGYLASDKSDNNG